MLHGYSSQILKIKRDGNTTGLSLHYYRDAFTAVLVRIFSVGLIIFDTHHLTAIFLGIAELIVLAGLAIIPCQMWWYQSGKEKFSKYPACLLFWDFLNFIKSSDK